MQPAADSTEEPPLELTLHIAREVKAYRLPARLQAGGHSSGTWLVDDCLFTGRLRVTARGQEACIRLEDSSTGELFAMCVFTPATQAVAVEATVDSSRHAFLGIGFSDRGAAFDFNAALADHAKQCQRESMVATSQAAASSSSSTGGLAGPAAAAGGPSGWQDPAVAALYRDPGDLSLKEGQTIRIAVKRPESNLSGGSGFLSRAGLSSGDGSSNAGGSRTSSGGGGAAPVLARPPVLLPPPGQPQQQTLLSPVGAAAAAAAAPAPAVTVASSEDNWATFD